MTFDFFENHKEELRLRTQIYEIAVGQVIVLDSFFGDFESQFYSEFFSLYFEIALENMNENMQRKSARIPNDFGFIKISNGTLQAHEGYLMAGVDLDLKIKE